MIKNKYNLFLTIIGILIIILVIFTLYVATHRASELEGIIVNREDRTYENEVLKTYSEYLTFLDKYSALGKLDEDDFIEYDYLIDIIPYAENMTIKKINVIINDDIIRIEYDINKQLKDDSEKVLINFIPIEKNNIDVLPKVTRSFK